MTLALQNILQNHPLNNNIPSCMAIDLERLEDDKPNHATRCCDQMEFDLQHA
jgi:hypothetical protein